MLAQVKYISKILNCLGFLACLVFVNQVHAATAIVTRTDDRNLTIANCPSTAGIHDCSLREAITFVNANTGADTLQFQNPKMIINLTLGELNIGATLTIEGNNSIVRRASVSDFRIISVNADSLITINNLTISNGSRGGIFLNGGAPSANLTLNNCTVSNNSNNSNGGGISVSANANLTLNNSTVSNNSSPTEIGGGIYNEGITAINSSFINNNRTNNIGGGILNWSGGTLLIQNSQINGNQTQFFGSGIFNLGSATVNGSTIDGNSTYAFSFTQIYGGAIFNEKTLFLNDSVVSRNTASGLADVAGIFNEVGANLTIMSVTNTTVSENLRTAIFNDQSLLRLTNVTVSNNQGYGGVVSIASEVNLRNTIIAGNSVVGGTDVTGNFTSLGNNLIGDVGSATGFGASGDIIGTPANPIDAHLRPLGNYGGATPTQPPFSSSPAINNGNNCILTLNACGNNAAFTTDQRGILRSIGGTVDIGAAEFHLAPAEVLQTDGRRLLPTATLNQNYARQFEAFGGIYFFEVTEGTLPPGMMFAAPFGLSVPDGLSSTATLSGTPTAAGTYQFTIQARNLANPNLNVSNNYTLNVMSPTAAQVSISGRVLIPDGRGVRNAIVQITDAFGSTRTTRTSSLGYYRFDEVEAGQTYIFQVVSKRFTFAPRVVSIEDELTDLDFIAQ